MDITYINEKSIKVSLSKEELFENGLEGEKLDYSTTRTKKFIWEILDRAYIETGFDAGNIGIFVRVFESFDGGCELFITKKEKDISKRDINFHKKEFVCKTDNVENLYQLCKRLKSSGFCGSSSLFLEKDNFLLKYSSKKVLPSYISTKKREIYDEKNFDFVCEYGEILELDDGMTAYLYEHCKEVCSEGAVEKIIL